MHVIVPEDLVNELDELVGARGRSRFVVEALREKLKRERLIRAADKAAGSLKDVDIPGWETSESTSAWVREQRRMGERDPWKEAE